MQNLEQLEIEIISKIKKACDIKALEEVRVSALGKQGNISQLMKTLGKLPNEERKEKGQEFNKLRISITSELEKRKQILEKEEMDKRLLSEKIDITLNGPKKIEGKIHPLSQTIYETINIFKKMGFAIAEGPEIEDDFHNFTALNVPEDHPARQEHDTFYLPKKEDESNVLLRTHTSPVQIRTIQSSKPPIKIIAPGRVYRSDYDATHTPVFHQIECLLIDENINMGHLKGCLIEFLKEFFEVDELPMRFRASYFPFTEPSAEVDISCSRKGNEIIIGEGDDWLEILGCGMIHPNVLKNSGLDPEKYQGFAFGMGLERIAMLKYGLPDLRAFYDNDQRWIQHYGFSFMNSLNGESI